MSCTEAPVHRAELMLTLSRATDLAMGLSVKQLALRLDIAAKTADHHVQNIYTKIGVSTRCASPRSSLECSHGQADFCSLPKEPP